MFEMDKFEEALQQHKDNLTKNLSEFGEGHRLNRMHKDIDSNAADYEYYFNAGQQSQQAKVEELQTQLSLQRQRVKAFEEELTSSRNYGDELQKRVDKAIRLLVEAELYQSEPNIDLAVKALKGEGHD